MKTNYLWMLLTGGVFVLLLLAFRPVSIPPEEECLRAKGIVLEIYEAGTKDVVIKLKDDPKSFYVNRGLEHGLDLKKLKFELLGREVTIKYPNHWTPIDPRSIHKHISKLESEDKVFFSEY